MNPTLNKPYESANRLAARLRKSPGFRGVTVDKCWSNGGRINPPKLEVHSVGGIEVPPRFEGFQVVVKIVESDLDYAI